MAVDRHVAAGMVLGGVLAGAGLVRGVMEARARPPEQPLPAQFAADAQRLRQALSARFPDRPLQLGWQNGALVVLLTLGFNPYTNVEGARDAIRQVQDACVKLPITAPQVLEVDVQYQGLVMHPNPYLPRPWRRLISNPVAVYGERRPWGELMTRVQEGASRRSKAP